ncbi:MAG: Methylglutaconyl-CoA hydratase (EC [uncultured Caballeronia sp.]|nr:MAG: Methylglutaconyl-CoA hydratase (EC [uncultured Caballeronia sp.]
MQGDLRTGLYLEIEAYNRLIPTEDRLESIIAAIQRSLVFRSADSRTESVKFFEDRIG